MKELAMISIDAKRMLMCVPEVATFYLSTQGNGKEWDYRKSPDVPQRMSRSGNSIKGLVAN